MVKTVVIAVGDSWDWSIDAILQCPDEMSEERADELYKEFTATYFSDKKRLGIGASNTEMDSNREYINNQINTLRASGYEGFSETQLFVSWLRKNHGCEMSKYETWYY